MAETKRAFITGITGQDGSYLAELLLGKDYEVHGLVRRSSSLNTGRIDGIYQDPHESHRRLFLHFGDLTDGVNLVNLLHEIQPHEVYNLGAMSHVKVSFVGHARRDQSGGGQSSATSHTVGTRRAVGFDLAGASAA